VLDPIAARGRRSRVAEHFDCLLIADPDNLLWLTGQRAIAGPACLVLTGGRWCLIARHGALPSLPDVEMISGSSQVEFSQRIAGLLQRRPACVDVAPPDSTLLHAAGDHGLHHVGPVIEVLRQVKDADEIQLIRENVSLLDRALGELEPHVHTASTEVDLWQTLASALNAAAGGDVEIEGNLASGDVRTRDGDPHASGRRLQDGDAILLDAYPRIHGYYADLTRTWCRGEPSAELERLHGAVLTTLHTVGAALRPGLTGDDVDRLARRTLDECGVDSSFPHHTGHGFGVKQQEEPWLRPGSSTVLGAGMVVAIEPGCYVPGVGGVRLEQDFLITQSGASPLGRESFSLIPQGDA